MSDHNPAPRRDPTPKQALTNIASQQLQREAERARNPYSVMIDEPPMSGQYVEIRNASYGVAIKHLQPPVTGKLVLNFKDGVFRGAELFTSMECP